MMNSCASTRRYPRLFVLLALLTALAAACDQTATTAVVPPPPAETQLPDDTGPIDAPIQPPSADRPLTGPLVGFYVEDNYEDVYFSIFDTATGALRLLKSGLPIYLDEAQWFDNGCRLFVHGQLIDLHGLAQWSVPPEVAGKIEAINTAQLSPDRLHLVYVVASGVQTGAAAPAADVEVVSLSPPFAVVRQTTHGGGNPRALAWSADGAWLYFTDYDAGGVLQIFRAAPDGSSSRQVTGHTEPLGAINDLAPSPDGRYLAYSVQTLLQAAHPYTYRPVDEGWVGIVDLTAGTSAVVRYPKFAAAEPGRGLVWDAASDNLLIIGDSLLVADDDPLAGRQVHWVAATGEVTRSLVSAGSPDGRLGWIAPLGDIDTLLVSGRDGFYIYAGGEFRRLAGAQAPPLGTETGLRPIGILPAPAGFPGEAACAP
ncbi:MAG: PD40 domain-containing protein [Candidatus Promineofilum sp.]|nr:PD40 domain-containing protein [Promineifilum sp.]